MRRAAADAAAQLVARAQLLCAAAEAAARTAGGTQPLELRVVGHVALSRALAAQQRNNLTRMYDRLCLRDADALRCTMTVRFWALSAGPPPGEDGKDGENAQRGATRAR